MTEPGTDAGRGTDRFARVEELFQEARRLPPAERAPLLEAAEPDVRREVASLLAEHDREADPFLATPALGPEFELAARPEEVLAVPERIGPYRILERIGMGGMGAVYLAEQDQPRRTVALKVIRPGWATPSLLRRFESEAEVLGRLRHPGIAQIYGAGLHDETAGGFPHIAMEYVDGRPLIEHVAKARPDLRARLALFADICDAVEHAHRRGVIHRDLKPGNILVESVDGRPRPKVLDFGVARLTDADVTRATLATSAGQLVGTLQYMSPEQAGGDPGDIDTRTDVYALGVILFELLTGRLPHDLGHRLVHQAVSVIQTEEPTTLASVDDRYRGDLDTIVAKALEKEKDRRYASAGELAADVRRFLADEPILARPPSALYQLRKFARRNRVLVAGAAAVFLTLLVGLGATAWQWREAVTQRGLAEERFDDLDDLARAFISEFDSTIMHVPGTLQARRLVVSRGLEYLDRLSGDGDLDPDRQQTIINGYTRIGDIQGAPGRPNLGDHEGALASYGRALAINARLAADDAVGPKPLENAASIEARIGDVLRTQRRHEAALTRFRAAHDSWEAYHRARVTDPRPPAPHRERIADTLVDLGRPDEAGEHYRLAYEEAVAWAERHPGAWEHGRDVAVAVMKQAIQEERHGRDEAALERYAEYLQRVEALLDDQPHHAILARDLATGLGRRRDVLRRLGRAAEAVADNDRAESLFADLVAADPTSAQALMDWAPTVNAAGEMALAAGDHATALTRFEQFCDITARLVATDPDNSAYLRRRGVALFKMGEVHAAREEWAPARDWFARSLDHFRDMETRGLLWASDVEAGVIAEIEGQVAACEAALADAGG